MRGQQRTGENEVLWNVQEQVQVAMRTLQVRPDKRGARVVEEGATCLQGYGMPRAMMDSMSEEPKKEGATNFRHDDQRW